jgi:hypothetical protein
LGLLDFVASGQQTPRALVYLEDDDRARTEALRGAGFDTVVAISNRAQRLLQLGMDAVALGSRVDTVVIATCDASLTPVLDSLRTQGLRAGLASFGARIDDFLDLEARGLGFIALGRESVFIP